MTIRRYRGNSFLISGFEKFLIKLKVSKITAKIIIAIRPVFSILPLYDIYNVEIANKQKPIPNMYLYIVSTI